MVNDADSDSEGTSLTYNQVWHMIRYFFTLLIFLSIFLLLRNLLVVNLDIDDSVSAVMVNRFLYSNDCFSYYDEALERHFPGVIDPTRLTNNQADNCVYFGEQNDYVAAQITLIQQDSEKQIYYNEEGYKLLEPRTDFSGSGSSKGFEESRYVLVREEERLVPGIFHIKLLIPQG